MKVCNKVKEAFQEKALWDDWRWQFRNRIRDLEGLKRFVNLTPEEEAGIRWAEERFPMAITPYLLSLIDPLDPECPVRKQVIPRIDEAFVARGDLSDPCGEESHSPVPGLVHRYPDRVLLLVTDTCASYCRYCTRRRRVGEEERDSSIEEAIEYIRKNRSVRDVLLSGGDPLILSTERLEAILKRIREIPHVEIIRIGTRVPVNLPQRIDQDLTGMLRRYHPIFMSIHFSHPKEITPECGRALSALADAGIPLGSQTVLLRGINDDPETMKTLMHGLLKHRVRPYYLYQADLVPGTSHFRTPVRKGIEIIERLRGFTTGYAVPTFVIDAPGGGGKVPVGPEYVIKMDKGKVLFRNYEGKTFEYIEPEE